MRSRPSLGYLMPADGSWMGGTCGGVGRICLLECIQLALSQCVRRGRSRNLRSWGLKDLRLQLGLGPPIALDRTRVDWVHSRVRRIAVLEYILSAVSWAMTVIAWEKQQPEVGPRGFPLGVDHR